jgi:hypothetical protein
MIARSFFVPGVIVLFCALILSLLVTVSLPSLPAIDIARAHFSGIAPHVSIDTASIREIRVRALFPFFLFLRRS